MKKYTEVRLVRPDDASFSHISIELLIHPRRDPDYITDAHYSITKYWFEERLTYIEIEGREPEEGSGWGILVPCPRTGFLMSMYDQDVHYSYEDKNVHEAYMNHELEKYMSLHDV